MGFTRIFHRRSSNTSTTVIKPITPQGNVTSPSTASSHESKTSLSKLDRVKHKFGKAFSLRRGDGVRTVTVNTDHYLASTKDSGYISSDSTKQNAASYPMTPVITKENAFVHVANGIKATNSHITTASTISKGADLAVNDLITTKPQYTNIGLQTLKPSKTKTRTTPFKTFRSNPDLRSSQPPHSKKAAHARVVSASVPVSTASKLREVIQTLAYNAALYRCPKAISTIAAIEDVQKLVARGVDYFFDPLFESNGFQFQASQLGCVEKDWITRVTLTRHLDKLERRRLLHADDCEVLKTSLFPVEKRHVRSPHIVFVLLDGLVYENLISRSFANQLRRLTLTMYEFLGGPASMGKPKAPQTSFHSTFFHIPLRAGPARIAALRHLIEAAIYPVPSSIWKGVYYADARGKLLDYCNAYTCTYHDHISTPPHLTEYKRDLLFIEQRMLLRAKLLLDMQARFDAGEISDYGLFKNIRGTYFYLPCQPHMDAEEFGRFLYARVLESGMDSSEIPGVVVLHPQYDAQFSGDVQAEGVVLGRLKEELCEFERLEEQRVADIECARASLKAARKAEQTKLERFSHKLQKIFRKDPVTTPFDPFQDDTE